MYPSHHPLYARYLGYDTAAEREALRQMIRPAAGDEDPTSLATEIPRWFAAFAVVVIGLAVIVALLAIGPSSDTQSAKRSDPSCQMGGVKVQSFAPLCPAVS